MQSQIELWGQHSTLWTIMAGMPWNGLYRLDDGMGWRLDLNITAAAGLRDNTLL